MGKESKKEQRIGKRKIGYKGSKGNRQLKGHHGKNSTIQRQGRRQAKGKSWQGATSMTDKSLRYRAIATDRSKGKERFL